MVDMHVTKTTNPIELTKPKEGFTLTPVDHDPFVGNEGVNPTIQDTAPKAEGGAEDQGWWHRMWGDPPDMVHVPPNTNYPDALDAHYAKQFNQAYGDEVDKYLQPGSKTKKMDAEEVMRAFGDISGRAYGKATATATTLEERDTIIKNWMAAQKSPVAALGFDPGATVFTPKIEKSDLNLAGFYNPRADTMWYNASDGEDVVVHESMHRGLEKLRNAGMLPKSMDDQSEELIVRALKQRYFGMIEKGHGDAGDKQVEDARWEAEHMGSFKKTMDDVEEAATKLIKQKKPGGPR